MAVTGSSSPRRKRRSVRGAPIPGGQAVAEPCDESALSRPGAALERAEDERTLQAALGRLTPEHRAVLVLKDIDGRKYDAIADILGVPIGTVRSRLHRARLELRDRLTGGA